MEHKCFEAMSFFLLDGGNKLVSEIASFLEAKFSLFEGGKGGGSNITMNVDCF